MCGYLSYIDLGDVKSPEILKSRAVYYFPTDKTVHVLWYCETYIINSVDHYDDVIMTMLASQITSLPVVCSIVYSDVNQRKHQSSASLAFVREIHRGPVNFPHKWPVTRKMFPFDDVIMDDGLSACSYQLFLNQYHFIVDWTCMNTLHWKEV